MRLDSVWAATLLYVVACSSGSGAAGGSSGGGSSGGALGDVPSCSGAPSQGVVKVQGTLGGQTVDVDQSPVSAGFSQLTTGQFDLPLGITIDGDAGGSDPGLQVHLMWAGIVADGDSAAATGTIELPAGSPDAQMSLCAGSGSKIAPNEQNNGLDFVLDGLTVGPACTQAVAGELRGCWGYARN